ncbi:hypothetical protein ACFO5O_02635 [Geojedonia litorea]|uniref:Glycosyltransferase RgtA/B/C/D-like domain-containing protein n=1 Tax=Geojedonia litorea TaxID=1268269 RepID=A0ABV9N3N8_9FLAO
MEQLIGKISRYLWEFDAEALLRAIPRTVLVFCILLLGYLSFDLNGNEEQYLLYAKQFMDPDWIASRYLNEFPGTRLLYQFITGFLLQFMSFESLLISMRLLLCLLYAIALGKIYKTLKVSALHILLHLPVLFLLQQSFFGGSWLFVSVEPKGFSYVFIVFALYYFMKAHYRTMLVLLIIGTYFHVLVGVYVFLFFMGTLVFFEKPKQGYEFLKLGLIYVLALVPFVLYLRQAVTGAVEFSPSVDWIYSYFRHPHHLGIFKDLGYFYSHHFYGVCTTFIALCFSLYFHRFATSEQLKRLNGFVLLSLSWVLIAVVIAFFDKEGVLLKYYPFRILTISTFVVSLLFSIFIFSSLRSKYLQVWKTLIILISFICIVKLAKPNLKGLYVYFNQNPYLALNAMGSYVKTHTKKDAVVLSFLSDLSLNRRLERDRFVVYKFIPADMKAIPEWYERELYKRQLANNLELLKDRKPSYKIDYVLAKQPLKSNLLELVHREDTYYLYKLTSE